MNNKVYVSSTFVTLIMIITTTINNNATGFSLDLPEIKVPSMPEIKNEVGDFFEDNTGYKSTRDLRDDFEDDGRLQELEDSDLGETGGDLVETATGYRSTQDVKIKETIPFVVPLAGVPIPGSLTLEGQLAGFEGKAEVSIAGFKVKDVFISDKKFSTTISPSINQLITDLAGMDIIREIEKVAKAEIGQIAEIEMDITVDWNKGKAYNDLTYCYKEFAGNVDIDEFKDTWTLKYSDNNDLDKNRFVDISENCETKRFTLD